MSSAANYFARKWQTRVAWKMQPALRMPEEDLPANPGNAVNLDQTLPGCRSWAIAPSIRGMRQTPATLITLDGKAGPNTGWCSRTSGDHHLSNICAVCDRVYQLAEAIRRGGMAACESPAYGNVTSSVVSQHKCID